MWKSLVTACGRTTALILVAVLVVVESSNLDAQTLQLRPHAGFNLPTRISFQNGTLHLRQKIGVTIGARLTATFNPRFDIVTALAYTPGYIVLRGGGRELDVAGGSQQLAASTGARYWLRPPEQPLSWEVHSRLGVVFGGHPAYADLFETSTISAIIGTAITYRIGRLVSLKLKIQERLYRVRLGTPDPGRSKSPFQVSFGVGLPFLESLR